MRFKPLILGFFVITLLWGLYGSSLWQLFRQQDDNNWLTVLHDPYVRHILSFSIWQALLSTILSVGLGLIVAHALLYQKFFEKRWLLKLFSLSMVLPVLVAIFGLLGVYGKVGWLASLLQSLSIDLRPNVYGLKGILIAHVFFNLPLSAKIFFNTLCSIPNQQRLLATQLGVVNWYFMRWVEWAYIRQQLFSVCALVFTLCFTSFTIVLVLGGGPKYTTLEVAIFQAVTFDFEMKKAAILASIQFIFCFILFVLSAQLSRVTPTAASAKKLYILPFSPIVRLFQYAVILLAVLFSLLPLLSVLITSFNLSAWKTALVQIELYRALGFSILIAVCAGCVCLFVSLAILLGARQFYFIGKTQLSANIVSMGMIILAVPTLVLAVGLFLLLQEWTVTTPILLIIVVLCNALMAMPFALRLLAQPLYDNMIYYEKLCQSLGISGWQRFRHIEWHHLKQPLRNAFSLSCALSLGDFTAIALFGNQNFTSLPRLLYQQLGNYRSQEASVTAFILLLLCVIIFLVIERYDDDKS